LRFFMQAPYVMNNHYAKDQIQKGSNAM
jgi:hypothetical protein